MDKDFLEIIKKWKLNLPVMAEKTGISLGVLKNKLYNNYYYFTEAERKEIDSYCDSLNKDLNKVKKIK